MKILPNIKYIQIILVLLILVLFSGFSCTDDEVFPIEPIINYNGFVKINDGLDYDNRGVLEFSYTDGDGDIGLRDSDSIAPYDYNLFINYYEMQNGEFKQVYITYYNSETEQYDTISLNARIPMLTPNSVNKAIKGIIQDTLFINNYSSSFDTVKFECWIMDRALHESNHIFTPAIIIDKE